LITLGHALSPLRNPLESDELIILAADIIPAGYCVSGAKAFCDRHNLDWRDIIANGISESRLLACNDALALKLINQAKIRTGSKDLG
jgi:hypothetical protein